MAAPTNTFISSNAVGDRESLHDIISILNKDECPFQAAIGAGSAEATYEEWQLDALGNADPTNAQLEGDDTTANAITPTTRVGNRTQILKKPFTISNTQEVVKKAGRDSEISYQTALAGRRIKMDLESFISQNQASQPQSGSNPRRLGGFESWLVSNVSRGTGGASGGFSSGNTTAPTDGTQRTSTEALLKSVIRSAWGAGGRPTLLLMGASQKQNFSAFTGIATQYQQAEGKIATVIGAVDRYVSDFGTFTAVASRYMRGREIAVVDPALWRVLWLRKWKKEELAKTGDARKFHVVGEVTLESRNEAGSGIVADLS
ncbi:MAG: DUF5309 domain-containing protein [Alphaproteobacteria bacterium]|nr:DUF5309 domain-containing protein [Alphaproteobacteria bacterium]MBV8410224.1 DUF5309 domain-containing protein [Alphaproteobacteria bacterium]